ncbi:MAG TPA: DNA helicase II [Clostridium sp.]|nr:DNA helicase II [Clostridium sp.]
MNNIKNNHAELAATIALEKLFKAIDDKKCFRLEAGAGAGKTYSLTKALEYLIKNSGNYLMKNNQRIACVTYTSVAKNEIKVRTDNNPVIFAETIHAFSWSLIQGLQKQMLEFIPTISEKWEKRIKEAGGLNKQKVIYDLGYPKATAEEITLHHDDVIKIITHFLNAKKFRNMLKNNFPIIFIDEYQDTNKELADSIVKNLIEEDSGVLIGFFGDHWQKIYGSTACGLITASPDKIEVIGKNANFRSDRVIVEMLNRMRPDLPQNFNDPDSKGQISIYHTNDWMGTRRKDNHWKGDLPAHIAHDYLTKTKEILSQNEWEFTSDKTKILMLTNNVLAEEQGYKNLISAFSNTDDYLKGNDHYIKFLKDVVEITCDFFEKKQYGEMFKAIGTNTPRMMNQADKIIWNRDLKKLIKLRETGTIGNIIDLLRETNKPRLSSKVEQAEKRYSRFSQLTEPEEIQKEKSFYDKVSKIKSVDYNELSALAEYIDDKTPFSTNHGVKGAEFENVLIVCGRGWNNYNWSEFLSWVNNGIPKNKEDAFERNRNLFYVTCSRPKKRLAILFTQVLSTDAQKTLSHWFGVENIHNIGLE